MYYMYCSIYKLYLFINIINFFLINNHQYISLHKTLLLLIKKKVNMGDIIKI